MTEYAADQALCDYCHLPLARGGKLATEPAYCCLGCRLAAEIAGQGGPQGAMHWTLARLAFAIFLSLNVMMFTMALWSQDLYDARAVGSGELAATLADLFRYLCLILSLPVLFLLGGPLAENALSLRQRGAAAADLLIFLGVVASYLYSAVSVVRGAGHIYFEVGCAVLVMVTLGRWFEASGKLKTTEALDALAKLLPDRVRTLDPDGRETMTPLDQLKRGDRQRVLAGERIATDGRLITGRGAIDQQMLTGESRPVTKQPEDLVLGGSLNLDGDLLVEVTAPVKEGSLARLVELVRQARMTRGHYQRLADRVAQGFLGGVIVTALATFAFHGLREGLDEGLMAGLAVLLIACPCALGLATPMAVWTALGAASRGGVLFRHGEALERLATIRAIRFDKTGTLTTGTPRIAQLVLSDRAEQDEVLRRAGQLAAGSTHVFSKAIAAYTARQLAARDNAPLPTATPGVGTLPGRGVQATFFSNEDPTRLGSLRWLQESGWLVDAQLETAVSEALARGESWSAIGWEGRVRGLFVLAETWRPETRTAIARCIADGCDVGVLTGDDPLRGALFARQLGAPVRAGLLPEEKVAALAEARRQFGPVAMVGDGINDAPALAASDLGIALGCGADVSRESAAVCLLGDDLRRVAWAIELSRRTVRVIRQNLFWAFAYNTLGIVLAAGGWLNPVWAALAMVLSSALVVANSLRLGREIIPLDEITTPAQGADEDAAKDSNDLASPAVHDEDGVPQTLKPASRSPDYVAARAR